MTLNERITELEQQVANLLSKLDDISKNTEEKSTPPYTLGGGNRPRSLIMPIDAKTGLGQVFANHVIWNDSESFVPPLNVEPDMPTVGYNKHSHSRYSGGALIKDVLEIVEYNWGSITNKHSQQFLNLKESNITTTLNSRNQTVKKRGQLDLVFNADTMTWGTPAYEIDIKKCYIVERDEDGNIAIDSKGQEKKSLLYNEDTNKTSIIWDENGQCWRFYSVYASEAEE